MMREKRETSRMIGTKTTTKVTKRDFGQFARMWAEGKINMWDIEVVKRHSGFSEPKILEMMRKYSELNRLYPEVWRKLKKEFRGKENGRKK